jgi:hypothetical protein
MEFGNHFDTEVLLEIEIIRQLGKATKNRLMKILEWGRKMVFTYWLKHGLVWVIEITSSNAHVFRSGGDLSRFIGVKIVVGLMWFITDLLLMEQGVDNIIGRGQLCWLRDVFGVDLQLAI